MTSRLAIAAVCLCFSSAALADEGLTAMGAQADGNAEGTIPAWSDARQPEPSADDLADPFATERPLFIISAQNVREFADRLSEGHRALFARYPDYTLPVYSTHRTAKFPPAVDRETLANEGRARLRGVDTIEGAHLGVPFRRPRSGVELAWNHRLRYRGDSAEWHYQRALVWAGGGIKRDDAVERSLFRYATLRQPTGAEDQSLHSYNMLWLSACEDQPGVRAVWYEPLNAEAVSRRIWAAWADSAGRAFRYPPYSHDQIGFCSYMTRFFDMMDMFNGAFDRYTFKLLGKRELYVPYNAYRLNDRALRVASLLEPGHLRQERSRYELHRVWVVDATLRPGQTHSVSRRTFYIDEDSWSILLVDCYDREGKLSRVQEGHLIAIRSIGAVDYAPVLTYDLADGRYFADRLTSESPEPRFNASGITRADFSPAGLRFE